MLTANGKKQEASYLYLHALATYLGYSVERVGIDMDSIDATICAKGIVQGSRGVVLSPKIDVQLKATEQECPGDSIPFAISKKNYNDLRQNTMVPRLLIVLFLPKQRDWFDWDFEKMLFYAKGYWVSLKGMAESENSASVTIHLPQSQKITPETIQQMMINAANREEIAYVLC